MNIKTPLTAAGLTILGILYLRTAPIINAISDQRRPHAHWYAVTLGKHKCQCIPATTHNQRTHIGQWIQLLPTMAVWHHHGWHKLRIKHNPQPITIIIASHQQTRHIIHLHTHNQTTWIFRERRWIILPGHPPITKETTITIRRRHVQEWDY